MLSSSEPDDEHISRNDRILKGDRIHFFNGAGERTKVPDDLRIRTFEYNITRTRTTGNPPVGRQAARRLCSNRNGLFRSRNRLKEAGNNGLCNRRLCRCKIGLCSSRNGDREGEGESDWLCSSSSSLSWRSTEDSAETRESSEKTEEVKPKQQASWKWKPRQKWEQDWALVVTRTGTRLRGGNVKESRVVLSFIRRHWRIGTGSRNKISSMKEQEKRS